MAKIAATIFTGFLGAGKTSLIRHLALNNGGQKFAFIINEFGDLGIDGQMLSGCSLPDCDDAITDDDVIELANGCICCTVADDFQPAIEKIIARKDKIDHIIIETSGLALPKPLVKAFNWPGIKPYVTVDAVVALVDAQALASGFLTNERTKIEKFRVEDDALDHETPIEELFEEQLQCADLIVLSKADLVDDAALKKIGDEIAPFLRAGVKVLASKNNNLAPELLLGVNAAAEDDLDTRHSHHDDGHDHDHEDFSSFAVTLANPPESAALEAYLQKLIAQHNILRVKGFIARENLAQREIIQAVGPNINRYFDRSWRAGENKQSRLVFIGEKDLNKHDIMDGLQKEFALL